MALDGVIMNRATSLMARSIAIAIFALFATLAHAQSSGRGSFDHETTGFSLSGAHLGVDCTSCHTGGRFRGTPRTCAGCHNGSVAPGKTGKHAKTSDRCESCHVATLWRQVRYDHSQSIGTCSGCHNGTHARGKSVKHVVTAAACETCHRSTFTFFGARMDHTGITSGCATCHNGTTAKGKPANHLPTTQSCDACHRTTTWDANFSHTSVLPGTCATCHNGVYAKGKPKEHPVTTQSCDACHTTKTFDK